MTTVVTPSGIEIVGDALEEFFERRARRAAAYHPAYGQLWSVAATRSAGGKLLRPRLFLAAHDALAPRPSTVPAPETVAVAVAIELLHYAFLLHDDVIDGDVVRRGQPNLLGSLLEDAQREVTSVRRAAAQHWANSCAILMGNLLLAESHQLIARCEVGASTRVRLLDLLSHAITESVVGEQLDVGLGAAVTSSEMNVVLDMSRLKTATYTFELPLRAAAILAGEDCALDALLATASAHLGLAFQLQDDLLSTFGDDGEHGKDRLSDLREGKETALIAFARLSDAWPSMAGRFGAPDQTETELIELREHLQGCGADAFVAGLVDEQLRSLHDLLAEAGDAVPERLRTVILDQAAALDGRRR